jgi:bacterioferritin (cytochrome b1)
MNLQLDEKYFLETDENNFILKELKVNQKTKEKYKEAIAYQSTLEQIMTSYMNKLFKKSKATTVEELLGDIRATKRYIQILFDNHIKEVTASD